MVGALPQIVAALGKDTRVNITAVNAINRVLTAREANAVDLEYVEDRMLSRGTPAHSHVFQ